MAKRRGSTLAGRPASAASEDARLRSSWRNGPFSPADPDRLPSGSEPKEQPSDPPTSPYSGGHIRSAETSFPGSATRVASLAQRAQARLSQTTGRERPGGSEDRVAAHADIQPSLARSRRMESSAFRSGMLGTTLGWASTRANRERSKTCGSPAHRSSKRTVRGSARAPSDRRSAI